MTTLSNIRNIGISAHIDSGKTTLTERILFYAGRIHRIQEIKDKDGGATMDFMELEKERGITITSAATTVRWNGKEINLIDTPGHVDFTVEVERSLRVLDGAILVLCAVGGVQSQSITVDRQMRRYRVPRIALVNKMDRVGADPQRVVSEMETKLGHTAVPLQIPIGTGESFEGVIDLVTMEAVYNDGKQGESVRREAIPETLREDAQRARHGMLETLSLYDDALMEMLLEEHEPEADFIRETIRRATIAREITPVLFGSAYRNQGVQPVLDAVAWYLPSPLDRVAYACDNANEGAEVAITADADAPPVAMAFKICDEPFGQITYARLYQGTLKRGRMYKIARTGKTQRLGRIYRLHADKREDIEEARAGDIVGLMGLDCVSGDTLCDPSLHLSLESMHVPEPVISIAVEPATNRDRDPMSKALNRFTKEDPTFHVHFDEETGQTILSGMGELHLEVYVERMRREYKADVIVGRPKVQYKETPTKESTYNHKHRKQTGGAGQYAHVVGRLVPLGPDAERDYEFENQVTGGRIPTDYIPSVDKGFQMARARGPLAGFEVVGVKMILEDGTHHPVDSSDLAFQICARTAFRQAVRDADPVLLEPIMRVEVEVPTSFQGSVTGDLAARRGIVVDTDIKATASIITAEVPLANMFGYATDLRSLTQGQATFSMEFCAYRKAPANVQAEILEQVRKEQAGSAKP
ncbi:MAG: elongation factor G [Planctomycetota bacterium]|nr:MAG: elongation factor G [Planctomycetota bacterium]